MLWQSLFITWARGGCLHTVSLVVRLLVVRQKCDFWKVVCLTFRPFTFFFLFVARNTYLFPKTVHAVNSFYLLQLQFPKATARQTGRTSSLFLNTTRNWGWGKREDQMFCYVPVSSCARKHGIFITLCVSAVVSLENASQEYCMGPC